MECLALFMNKEILQAGIVFDLNLASEIALRLRHFHLETVIYIDIMGLHVFFFCLIEIWCISSGISFFFFTIMVFLLLNVSKYRIWFGCQLELPLCYDDAAFLADNKRHICSRLMSISFWFSATLSFPCVVWLFVPLSGLYGNFYFLLFFDLCFQPFLKAKYLYSGIHIQT